MAQKKVTIHDLARHFEVSTSTISRALRDSHEISESLKKKIKAFADEVGYRPNRAAATLRAGKSKTVGLIVPSLAYHFNVQLIAGVEAVLTAQGYRTVIVQSHEETLDEQSATDYLLGIGVDGIICSLAANTTTVGHLHQVLKHNRPVVLVDRTMRDGTFSQVMINHELASAQAVKHLLARGCQQIAWITGPQGLYLSDLRQQGYERALIEAGMSIDQSLICHCSFNSDRGYNQTRKLLEAHPNIDGIYVINDRIAIGVMAAIRSMNKSIPQDIAVIGFNNDPIDELVHPTLSSVKQPAREMGAAAAKTLLSHLRQKEYESVEFTFDTELVIRASSAISGHEIIK